MGGPNFAYRVRSAPLASRSGRRHRAFLFYRHPASVPCASFSASCRKRRSAHDARSPLGRSGAVYVRRFFQSLLTSPSLRSVAAPRRTRRRLGRLRVSPSMPRSPGGILPPGLVMRRHPCRRLLSALSRLAASCRRLRRHPVVASLSLVHNQKCGWSASSRRASWASSPPTKKATLRWPRRGSLHSGAGASFHIKEA